MATALQGFRLTARSCKCTGATKQYLRTPIGARRALSSTPIHWKRSERDTLRDAALEKVKASSSRSAQRVLHDAEGLGKDLGAELQEGVDADWEELFHERIDPAYPPYKLPHIKKKVADTFLNLGEVEPWESEEMMEDDEDDITSLGHGELERHREMRHYSRLIAWEMPLLSKLAKPFVPPTADMPLRFRYTSYMGEHHPAEKKVVVEFTTADMPNLTPIQRQKFAKLVGVRYNPLTDIVKMSCEMYETQAQNKRYLGDTIDALLIEARDPTDTFEDVPLDTRHHHFKPRPHFPEAWTMTPARRLELEQHRLKVEARDARLELNGKLVDGILAIEDGLKQPKQAEAVPEVVMAGRAPIKGQKRMAVRRT